MGESRVLGFVIGEVVTAVSVCILEEGLAARDKVDLGLTVLGLRARVLGGTACSSSAGEATP
jgi:hypothetical protein